MDTTLFFKIANNTAMLGWLLLLIVPKWKYTIPFIVSAIIFFLTGSYTFIIVKTLPFIKPDVFSSLATIRNLFQNDIALLAGWVHYLAFDLFVGIYIVKESEKCKIHRLIVTLLLPLTFLFGPIGYAAFQIIKTIKNQIKK